MRKSGVKFDFDDLLLIPKTHTNIVSRYSDINPYYKVGVNSYLPIITAPMDNTVDYNKLN